MTSKWWVLCAFTVVLPNIACASETIYKKADGMLFDGAFGPIASFQRSADAKLGECGSNLHIDVDGRFGNGTKRGVAALARCSTMPESVRSDATALEGAISANIWKALVAPEVPSVDERARTLMLTYEATDYTRMEWNFCQSRPLYNPAEGRNVCFSNDPHSYLTWGPNGATGGGGREVQLILQAIDKRNARLLDDSFGGEAAAVRRMFKMPDRNADRTLETYLCGIWAAPNRREAWRRGFSLLGQDPMTRDEFDALYRSQSLDGGKIRTFIRAYSENGLTPSEVDYAFFKDRSAHTSPQFQQISEAVRSVVRSNPSASPWKVRRSIALNVRPSAQRADRLGRDVAFYLDAAGLTGISSEERTAWRDRGQFRASDVGLSDERAYTSFQAGPSIQIGINDPAQLTLAERNACPAAVLNTRQP